MRDFEEAATKKEISKVPYEQLFNERQLKMLRLRLDKKVFEYFLKSYVRSLTLQPK